jgi:uncharacterized protein (DUF1015 family)
VATQRNPSRPPLRLRPFRGMRYDSAVVGDIAAVTSPPYDVMDRPMIDALLQQHSRNIVRLILPRMVNDPVTGGSPYDRAAKRLERWRRKGVLATDADPALYVYEYGGADRAVCGLVGAVELHHALEQVILPHEDVIAGIVADRLAMMTASRANLEPILLVYDGAGATAALIDAARARTPLVDVNCLDGTYHRLWSVTSAPELRSFEELLAPHQALIADGHHRYATYLQLRDRLSREGVAPGAAGLGLALLVDQSRWPLAVSAIHRSLSEFGFDSLRIPDGFELSEPEPVAVGGPPAPTRIGELVLTDGASVRVLRAAPPRAMAATDAELLHEILLPAWGLTDDRVGYHHTIDQTLRSARQDGGIAVLLHPTTVAEVMAVARAGRILPRKSTSFGPKPRMGLVMRSFNDQGDES